MITEFDEWNFELRSGGHCVIYVAPDNSFDVPLSEHERLYHEITATNKAWIEFTTVHGNECIYRREAIDGLTRVDAEYVRRFQEARREELLKE